VDPRLLLLLLKPTPSSGNSGESGGQSKMQRSYWGALVDLLFETNVHKALGISIGVTLSSIVPSVREFQLKK